MTRHRAKTRKANTLPMTHSPVHALRTWLRTESYDFIVIPRVDSFQGEYTPARDNRLYYATGFHGSAGTAIIGQTQACLAVDGRYTLQAQQQVCLDTFDIIDHTRPALVAWLQQTGITGKIAIDPMLMTEAQFTDWHNDLSGSGLHLIKINHNPVDSIWETQPPPPSAAIRAFPDDIAGATSAEKRHVICAHLQQRGHDALFITAPDSLCWLLNIRGNDVPYTPFVLAYALLWASGDMDVFCAPARAPAAVQSHLGTQIHFHAPDMLLPMLHKTTGKTVQLDPAQTPVALADALRAANATLAPESDPCQLPKAIKTPAEIKGMDQAHLQDGVALCTFLCWLDATAGAGQLTEYSAAQTLDTLRRRHPDCLDLSFTTISGAAENGAIVHYSVAEATARPLFAGDIYLVDSGGQYHTGTTDVTRTVLIPPASACAHYAEIRTRFTQVLKGHIALSRARFPAGTKGAQLDVLARQFLWADQVDYRHGTGHGVGVQLSVHEGPHGISPRATAVGLQAGMIVSNEPGYYKTGAYGIRLENLVLIHAAPPASHDDAQPMLAMRPLTLAPFDQRLIDIAQITPEERAWLDAYHAHVYASLHPLLPEKERQWLHQACAPLPDARTS
jgi:Xaa-Pro aminopeptidase